MCGMATVRRMEEAAVDADERPLRPLRILRCGERAGERRSESSVRVRASIMALTSAN